MPEIDTKNRYQHQISQKPKILIECLSWHARSCKKQLLCGFMSLFRKTLKHISSISFLFFSFLPSQCSSGLEPEKVTHFNLAF